jgi:ABC-2 type transport system ATP-binding protein
VIEIIDLYKYYGERRAVGPLSFTIEAGEIVGLVGLNGAGKTTTLRILACDLLPSSGSVRVDGIDVVERPHEVRGRIGYLPDTPPLYSEMTVRDYLKFAASLRGMSRAEAERRVPEVEEMTQLQDVAGEPITSLSHGYKQRVGIAQAVVHKPRLLVLDEPITGLDPVQIVDMRKLLRSLKGDHTILLSSHILPEISETCDRLLVIRDGAIEVSGTEAELKARHLEGMRIEITVRAQGFPALGSHYRRKEPDAEEATRTQEARDRAVEIAKGIEGVTSVNVLDAAEPGEGIVTLRVEANRVENVREALCAAFVREEYGLLGMQHRERELEALFLHLVKGSDGSSSAAAQANAKGSERRAAAKAKKEDEPAEESDGGGKDGDDQ